MKNIGAVIVKEVREGLPSAILFLFLFHMISATKAVSLGNYNIDVLRATTATISALLVAKSILVVEVLPLSKLFSNRGLINILWKTALFGLVVLMFRFIEELFHSLREHDSFETAVTAMLQGITWPVFWIVTIWIIGGLLLYTLLTELTYAVGPDKTRKLLLFGEE
jgi:hypothetical protein